MQTDKIRVASSGEGLAQALEEVPRFAAYAGLNEKQALRFRLLAEEMLGMLSAITGDFEADFWIESKKRKGYSLHLRAETFMDYAKKKELIAASTKKKNAASTGFMGKIKDMIEDSIYNMDELGRQQVAQGGVPMMYGMLGSYDADTMSATGFLWSMEHYREGIETYRGADRAAGQAWDELEKSIVANIADEVRVSVRGDVVELVIEKKAF